MQIYFPGLTERIRLYEVSFVVNVKAMLDGMALDIRDEGSEIDDHTPEDIEVLTELNIYETSVFMPYFMRPARIEPMRKLLIFTSFVLLMAACGFGDSAQTTTTQVTTTAAATEEPTPSTSASTVTEVEPSSTITIDGMTVDLTSCDSAGGFEILCEAYDYLKEEYVDELDDAVLAAGAARGIEEFLDAEAGTSSVASLICPLPSEAFDVTCEAASEALATHDTTPESIAEAAVVGLFVHGLDDPNSNYLSPEAMERLAEEQSGTISGIGSLVVTEEDNDNGERIRCGVITETCRMYILSVIENGPAESQGLLSGDIVVSVNGVDVLGWTSEEIVGEVRGPEGEPVTIGIERDGEAFSFTIVRAPIVVPVTSTELFEGGVGYVKLSQFTGNSGPLFQDALQEMIDAGATKLIIDFRNNPGGTLNAAISVASEFLDDGLVLRTEAPDGGTEYRVTAGGVATSAELEIVVIVNRGSASASEVVAGVLQEEGRAVIIGEPTYGKNTVQQQYGLSNGGAVKVTIARWVTPNGVDFGSDGIQPDIPITLPANATTDFYLDEALAYFGVTR